MSRARTHKRGAKPSLFPRSRVSACALGHYFNFKMASELWRYPIKMRIKLYLKKSFEVLFFVIVVVVVVSLFSFLSFFFFNPPPVYESTFHKYLTCLTFLSLSDF